MFLKKTLGQKFCGVKSNLGVKQKLGFENFWKQIVGGQDYEVKFLGVLKCNQGSYVLRKTGEPTIYGGCDQTLPFYLYKMGEFIFQCYV